VTLATWTFVDHWRWHVSLKNLKVQPWWFAMLVTLRAIVTVAVLLALYYLLPFDADGTDLSAFGKLMVGLVFFLGLMIWHVRLIGKSEKPALRALEGLILAVPLFLLLFAAAYFRASQGDVANFTSALSKTDSLYFTITIFSTVGFGDISAQTETTRLMVSTQMILDLIILGFGAKVVLGAVQRGRQRLAVDDGDGDEPTSDGSG
jgi:voltage-gated potassium channel